MTAVSLWRFSRSSKTAFQVICMVAFCLAGLVYFATFSEDLDRYLFREGYFQLALNSHDHLFYVTTLEALRTNGIEYGLNNDFGIAAIYWVLCNLFPFLINDQLTLISFIFNTVVLIPTYVLWVKICDFYGFGTGVKLSFFLNLSLLYFMQLINKDMLTIFAFLFTVYAGIHRRSVLLVMAIPLFFLVRQQLAVFAILFIYFMQAIDPRKRILIAYFLTSVVAGILSVFASVIGEDSLGGGFNSFLTELNAKYYVGYLVFNPIRAVQYLFDAYLSFSFFTEAGGVDVAKLLRLPQLIFLAILWRPSIGVVMHFRSWLATPIRPVVLTIVAYFLAWLMNPTVNARYVILITPILILFALYARKHGETAMKARAAE